jgi:hypothetical protein
MEQKKRANKKGHEKPCRPDPQGVKAREAIDFAKGIRDEIKKD